MNYNSNMHRKKLMLPGFHARGPVGVVVEKWT